MRPRNGVRICLNQNWQDKVISVDRGPDNIISMKMVTPGRNYNIIYVYAPQQGCVRMGKKSSGTKWSAFSVKYL